MRDGGSWPSEATTGVYTDATASRSGCPADDVNKAPGGFAARTALSGPIVRITGRASFPGAFTVPGGMELKSDPQKETARRLSLVVGPEMLSPEGSFTSLGHGTVLVKPPEIGYKSMKCKGLYLTSMASIYITA